MKWRTAHMSGSILDLPGNIPIVPLAILGWKQKDPQDGSNSD